RWLYWHVHAFQAMREPQKFGALVALGLCAGFGWGVDVLTRDVHRDALRAAATTVLAGFALAYTPNLFGGLDGHLSTSKQPAEWAGADRTVGAGADASVLFLPWHLYLAFPFTDGRVIANPADDFFRRTVVAGDNVELPNVADESPARRSAYLVEEMAIAREGGTDFAARIAPLDVGYVVLAKTADWPGYAWLNRQPGLVKLLDSPALSVWRVSAIDPQVQRVRRSSPTSYRVAAGAAGPITVPEPFDPGWRLGDQRPQATHEGLMTFTAPAASAVVQFTPWRWVRLGYLVSVGAALLAGLLSFIWRPRGRSGRHSATGSRSPSPPT
ncbi:MAG: hypothetical protein QOJ03_220, partial [Frankiaceae bacterium]|nr:hypothetical protein [Frankiaceae bacterium]